MWHGFPSRVGLKYFTKFSSFLYLNREPEEIQIVENIEHLSVCWDVPYFQFFSIFNFCTLIGAKI